VAFRVGDLPLSARCSLLTVAAHCSHILTSAVPLPMLDIVAR
jgi:hypothetical protein